jgi:hypothetical protein
MRGIPDAVFMLHRWGQGLQGRLFARPILEWREGELVFRVTRQLFESLDYALYA